MTHAFEPYGDEAGEGLCAVVGCGLPDFMHRTPTSDPVAAAWEAFAEALRLNDSRTHHRSGPFILGLHRPFIEEAIRQQARAAFAAQVEDVKDGAWEAGYAAALRSVAASPEPASPEAPGSGLREAVEAVDSALQAALSGQGVTDGPARWREERWVPASAIESAMVGLPCPMRSSLTDAPCVLTWGHLPDIGRYHRFARPDGTEPASAEPASPEAPGSGLDVEPRYAQPFGRDADANGIPDAEYDRLAARPDASPGSGLREATDVDLMQAAMVERFPWWEDDPGHAEWIIERYIELRAARPDGTEADAS